MPTDTRAKFLKVLGLVWGGAILAVVLVALFATHAGRMADFVLHQTAHRDWSRLTLHVERRFFDLSTPLDTIKSYYSALYRGDADAMQQLTSGVMQQQMRPRMAEAQRATGPSVYRSYLRVAASAAQNAIVVEKFHLFWQQGLHFHLRQNGAAWHIDRVQLLP
jgi:hypothetical protein